MPPLRRGPAGKWRFLPPLCEGHPSPESGKKAGPPAEKAAAEAPAEEAAAAPAEEAPAAE